MLTVIQQSRATFLVLPIMDHSQVTFSMNCQKMFLCSSYEHDGVCESLCVRLHVCVCVVKLTHLTLLLNLSYGN